MMRDAAYRSSSVPVRNTSSKLFGGFVMAFVALFTLSALMLIFADLLYIDKQAVLTVLTSVPIRHALWMSIWTSCTATLLSVLFAIPMGYALSRYRFPGRFLADVVVDLPIVFPPLVIGMTLLVFFSQTSIGQWIEGEGMSFIFQPKGIVLCQFAASASYAIRAAKVAFDEVDTRYEHVALTLGCTQWESFRRVSLPMAKNGIIAGSMITWAHAFGLFGPLIIFVGSFRGKTEVLSTTIFLEQSIGNLEVALAVAMLLVFVAAVALAVVRLVGGKSMVKI